MLRVKITHNDNLLRFLGIWTLCTMVFISGREYDSDSYYGYICREQCWSVIMLPTKRYSKSLQVPRKLWTRHRPHPANPQNPPHPKPSLNPTQLPTRNPPTLKKMGSTIFTLFSWICFIIVSFPNKYLMNEIITMYLIVYLLSGGG